MKSGGNPGSENLEKEALPPSWQSPPRTGCIDLGGQGLYVLVGSACIG